MAGDSTCSISTRPLAPDYETYNWFTSTHPRSMFVNLLIAGRLTETSRYIW